METASKESTPVVESGEAPKVTSTKEPERTRCAKWICCLSILALCAIAVILAIYFTVGFGNVRNRSGPTSAPTTALYGEVFDIVERYTEEETFLDPDTPQGMAFLDIVGEVEDAGAVSNPERISQRYALLTVARSMGLTQWDGISECSFFGTTVCRYRNDFLAVVNVELPSKSLSGTIPSEICALSYLEKLDMSKNLITGSIPSCIADLDYLQHLILNENSLSGPLPPGLLASQSMQVLDVESNQLTGTVDALFEGESLAKGMTNLVLSKNLLSGGFPQSVLQMEQLTELRLNGNNMAGEVPQEACNLQGSNTGYLSVLTADCEELKCACCTNCFFSL